MYPSTDKSYVENKRKMITDNSLNERIIAAIDLGTCKTSLAVARAEGKDAQILYYKSAPSKGIDFGEVINPGQARSVVAELIRDAEEELHLKISQVVAGMPRCNITRSDATGSMTRENPEECITEEEVDAVKSIAKESLNDQVGGKEKIYGVIAQAFSTDEYFQQMESDVVGMTGSKLDGHFKVYIGKSTPLMNLTRVFNDLRLGIARTYFTPLATAKAVLTDEETSNGVALIDFGAGATSISIFKKDVLVGYYSIPFGGDTITGDVRTECRISERLAENLKKAFGGCMPEKLLNLGEKIIQIETDDLSSYSQIPVMTLSDIITARVKEIVDAMLYAIQENDFTYDLRNGIVITGGGAEMLNLSNYIRELSGYNIRIGYPRPRFGITGCENILKSDASTIAGLTLMALDENLSCCTYNDDPAEYHTYTETPKSAKKEPAAVHDVPVTEPDDDESVNAPEPKAEEAGHIAEQPKPDEDKPIKEQPSEKTEEKKGKTHTEHKEAEVKKESWLNKFKNRFTVKISSMNDEINGKTL